MVCLGGYIYKAHFVCHEILMLGKSPIKWKQSPDITIAVDWDVKHQFKHTKPWKEKAVYVTVSHTILNAHTKFSTQNN